MVMSLIISIAIVVVFACIANVIMDIRKSKIVRDRMSFRETMDLCSLPIITFINNDKKVNFLLDTGATTSIIDKNVLHDLKYDELSKIGDIYGMEGNIQETPFIAMSLIYKDKIYEDEFQVVDMSGPFGNLKADYGVNIHGVLSSTFFQKYKYILDFEELVAYCNV